MKFEEGKVLSSMTVDIAGVENSVIFRLPKQGDAEGMMNAVNSYIDEDIYLAPIAKVTLEQEEKWFDDLISECLENTRGMIVVEVDGTLSGTVELAPGNRKSAHTATMGLAIKKEIRGKGIGSRAIQLAMDYAIEAFGTELFWLDVFTENTGAIRLYESLGFTRAGEIPGMYKWKGKVSGRTSMFKEVGK